MRRVVIILAALLMAGAGTCRLLVNVQERHCATTLEYTGVSYVGYEVAYEVVGEGDGAVGTERGCGDEGPWSDEVAVARVPGVDPRIALVTPVAANVLYVARGVPIDELPSGIAELVTP